MKNCLLIALVSLFLASSAMGQEIDPRSLFESRQFTFNARTALPAGASAVYLTSAYDLRMQGDTLKVHLPYFGRSFAPVYPGTGAGALEFTSTQFGVTSRKLRKGGWEMRITPADHREVRQIILTTGEDGFAYLQVLTNNRQPISFNGTVRAERAG